MNASLPTAGEPWYARPLDKTSQTDDERINILFKDGSIRDISEVDNALIQQSLAATVGKQYICYLSV